MAAASPMRTRRVREAAAAARLGRIHGQSVVDEVVLGEPDLVEAELFRPLHLLDEIAERIYRLSTFLARGAARAGSRSISSWWTPRSRSCSSTAASGRCSRLDLAGGGAACMDVRRLRWITFSHIEADECGALGEWLAAAPARHRHPRRDRLRHLAERSGAAAARGRWPNGEVLDLGGRRVRRLDTPHVPHRKNSRVMPVRFLRCLRTSDGVRTAERNRSRAASDTPLIRNGSRFRSQPKKGRHAGSRSSASGRDRSGSRETARRWRSKSSASMSNTAMNTGSWIRTPSRLFSV